MGLIDRVQINTLFARGNAMLKNMTSKKRRREIAEAIKECFRKKKKEALAEEFEEKI